MTTPEAKLRIEEPGPGLRLLIIDRPSRRNALDEETYGRLRDAIAAADGDPAVRAIIVAGAGGHFTAGNDLSAFQGAAPSGPGAAMLFLHALNACATPILGAVEGNAVGIGVTMLLHFDFAYAARGAKMRLPFAPLGLCPEGASSYLLPRVAGLKRATEWLLLGEFFSGEQAAEAGIVTAAVADGTALENAMATAKKIAALPPEAARVTKMLLRRASRATVAETLDIEAEEFRRRLASREAQAAFAAFFAKAG